MSNVNATMMHARRLELGSHPAPPAGAEVHSQGIRHETQRGDSAFGIARQYSQAFHMDISAKQLQAANVVAFSNGLQPGELLVVPGLEAREDTMFRADNPGLVVSAVRLVHQVRRGDSLSSIARKYSETNGLRISSADLYAANRSAIGSDPNKIFPGQKLAIPGITTASPKATLQTLSQLDNDVVITRTANVQHEAGGIEAIDVIQFHADGSHAEQRASLTDAISAATLALKGNTARSNPIAIVQTRNGAYHTMPLRGVEMSGNLDDSDRTLSLGYRSDDLSVIAVAERRSPSSQVSVRRFDR